MKGKIPGKLASPLAASLGAFTATSPAVIAFFGVLRPAGIAAGLIVVPLSTFFMAVSIPAISMPSFISGAAGFILVPIQTILRVIVLTASHVPGIKAPLPAVSVVTIALAAAVFVFSRRRNAIRSYLDPFD
jgi:competence protein ComEC